jgi:transposase
LNGFSGTLQADGYAGYNRLLKRPAQDVTLAYCWAHARRKLDDVTQSGAAPIAQEGLAQTQALYRIGKDLRGLPADQRYAARQDRSKPIMETFGTWLAQSRARVSAKSPTGEALKYIAKYWDGLILFLHDGRIELDNNPVERRIRPIALSRKNALCAGHDAGTQNWASIASLIETCKLNGSEPHSYLSGVLTAIATRHEQADINDLLPWNYTKPVRLAHRLLPILGHLNLLKAIYVSAKAERRKLHRGLGQLLGVTAVGHHAYSSLTADVE